MDYVSYIKVFFETFFKDDNFCLVSVNDSYTVFTFTYTCEKQQAIDSILAAGLKYDDFIPSWLTDGRCKIMITSD